jgi:hypothetical protein
MIHDSYPFSEGRIDVYKQKKTRPKKTPQKIATTKNKICLEKWPRLGMVALACNTSALEAESGGPL